MNKFNGFPKELPDFLFDLKFHNTIEKQEENLIKYRKIISEPLKMLYEELKHTAEEISPIFETRANRCVSTPYTDRRFSPAAPLKEYMYIRFKFSGAENNIIGLYFDMGCDFYSYGLRIYKQNVKGMDRIREKILHIPEKYSSALDFITQNGFKIIGEKYKKDKCPELPDGYAKELYNMKGFYIGKDTAINQRVFTEELAEEIKNGFRTVANILCLLSAE